jgi:probable HAF family extracellular repeat protein
MTDLGTLGGLDSYANDINDKGQVVGASYTNGGAIQAFLYSDRTMTELSFGGSYGVASAINKKGQVIGYSDTGGRGYLAFLYSDGTMTEISLGGVYGGATGIDKKGHVVGYSGSSPSDVNAFLYIDGTITDLTELVYDLFLVSNFYASDIQGFQIIGYGYPDGNRHAYILTVPKK